MTVRHVDDWSDGGAPASLAVRARRCCGCRAALGDGETACNVCGLGVRQRVETGRWCPVCGDLSMEVTTWPAGAEWRVTAVCACGFEYEGDGDTLGLRGSY